MNKEERITIYKKALETYGTEPQVYMVFEECGELINALAKYHRGRANERDIITELADVSIMVEQMATMINYDEYLKEKDNKIIRLKERLEKHGHKDNS